MRFVCQESFFWPARGGVGKTSVSAATGIKTAENGLRTIIMSLDVAHSLADVFDLDMDLLDQNRGEPVKIRKNLWLQEKEFDVILLDCAPTGESLRLISIPTTLEWYMKKLFKMERRPAKYVFPVAKRLVDVPLPDDDYYPYNITGTKRNGNVVT